jgi:sugar (pentulose or hexulose) kinase
MLTSPTITSFQISAMMKPKAAAIATAIVFFISFMVTFKRNSFSGKFLLLEDYFLNRLTGEYVCEGSLATSTCYWNFRTKEWWPEMLKVLGITTAQLPRYIESGVPVGKLLPKVAKELGLSPQNHGKERD